tara:strand:+ start:168 stop:401 length:234 start_codon:yes stop_codon:yes gene_type:complete
MTIIISKGEKFFRTSCQKKMHKLNVLVYVLCISIIGILGIDTINNFKKDFVKQGTEKTESLSTSLSSYSEYLQTLAY